MVRGFLFVMANKVAIRINNGGRQQKPALCYRPASCGARLESNKVPVLVVDDEPDNLDAIRFNFGKSFSLLLAAAGKRRSRRSSSRTSP